MTEHNKCFMVVIYENYESNIKTEVRECLRKGDA